MDSVNFIQSRLLAISGSPCVDATDLITACINKGGIIEKPLLKFSLLRLVGDNISQALDRGDMSDVDTLVLKSIENEIIGMNLFLCLSRGWIKRTDASPENLPSVLDVLD